MEYECEKWFEFRQMDDCSCGVAALRFLFYLTVWQNIQTYNPYNLDYIPKREDLHTTYKDGTNPKNICKYLDRVGIRYIQSRTKSILHVDTPCLVLFRSDNEEDHYGVILEVDCNVKLFCPWYCRIEKYSIPEFNSLWWTKRYGRKWSLSLR